MSRLLVKNLPKVTEEALRKTFGPYGQITDVRLLYKEDGAFRNLAHIGYIKEEQAKEAQQKLNGTFIKGNKICIDLWDESKVKSSMSVEKRLNSAVKVKKKKSGESADKNFDNVNTVKLRNLPQKCKRSQLRAFFAPLKPLSIRIPSKFCSFAYVKLKDRKDFKMALQKNKDILEGKQLLVVEYVDPTGPRSGSGGAGKVDLEVLMQTGRLFIRNLAFDVEEEHLSDLFSKYQPIQEINIVRNLSTHKCKGYAYVSLTPEQALRAYNDLDRSVFQGRILHLIPSEPSGKKEEGLEKDKVASQAMSSFKKEKLKTLREDASESHNWNTLFFSTQALMGLLQRDDRESVLKPSEGQNPAVLLALKETNLVDNLKIFFVKNGINFDSSVNPSSERSSTIIVVKNLPANTQPFELKSRFDIYGPIKKFLMPEQCVLAIVEYEHPHHAQKAFKNEAYAEFHNSPLFLEWAPLNIFKTPEEMESQKMEVEESKMECDELEIGSTLYVKNINFLTQEKDLEKHFAKVGKIVRATIARNKATGLSNGYGFVEFADSEAAQSALKTHQSSKLDDHFLQLSISRQSSKKSKKFVEREPSTVEESNKLLIRNVAFQANKRELVQLFQTFGELNYVRLPKKKAGGTGNHRGFAFVEFKEQSSAKEAYNKLKNSTHFYGRRLVVEYVKPEQADVDEE